MERVLTYVDRETVIRLGCFVVVLMWMTIWELAAPRRKLTVRKSVRWVNNLGLVVLNTVALRLFLPLGAAGLSIIAQKNNWGLFNNVSRPVWVAVVVSVIALDFVVYLQHVLFHAVPVLWRLHMVHHADLDIDVSTGLRFHTIEILLSMVLKLAAVVLLGPPAVAVLTFEVVLNGTSLFNHANIRLPHWLDRVLRLVVVTPDMHRVHHSVVTRETNSNYGFSLPWWDFLFRTYGSEPELGHEKMTIGLPQYRDPRVERLDWMLSAPFVASAENDREQTDEGSSASPPTKTRDSPERAGVATRAK